MSFVSTKHDELSSLHDKLTSNYPRTRKEAVVSVISKMRAGENVQCLFSDMLQSAKTDDLELKKLVYLYLVNYSISEPEQAIMVVNTFIQDSMCENPLIRALAVRTMCRIKLENVAEHMIIPVKKALKDEEPFVRKTAVLSVAKLYEIIPDAVENANIFEELIQMLNDENPMVVSNTTAALLEINERREKPIFKFNSENVAPVLSALTSSTEWCQSLLLDALSHYKPCSDEDASFLIDRLIPLLKNTNPSVVVGAFRCIFLYLEYDKRDQVELFNTIIPPFITLVSSSEYEIQYVVLKTLSLFVQRYQKALGKDIQIFFCKYNDPSYIKMEKLNIIVTICTEATANMVLDELFEYCNSVDVAFVRKSIQSIGQVAIRIPESANKCVDILVSLVEGKADYAIEEAVIIVSDILRRYPGTFESVIAAVCQNFEQIKEKNAKAAAIWILGEYCSVINNVDTILDSMLDSFSEEQEVVQLQLLTAFVKLYLEKPDDTRDLIQCILSEATKNDVSPDVRNRAYIYWKLLSTNNELAQTVIKFNKKDIDDSCVKFDEEVLTELLSNMGTVSGILQILPNEFVSKMNNEHEYNDSLYDNNTREWTMTRIYNNVNVIDLYVDFDQTTFYIKLTNKSSMEMSGLAIAINKNPIGLTFASTPQFPKQLEPNESTEIEIPIIYSNEKMGNFESGFLDIAIKTGLPDHNTVFAQALIPFDKITISSYRVDKDDFRMKWATTSSMETIGFQNHILISNETLFNKNIFLVGKNNNKSYYSFMIPPNNQVIMFEAIEENNSTTINYKSQDTRLSHSLQMSFSLLLQSE